MKWLSKIALTYLKFWWKCDAALVGRWNRCARWLQTTQGFSAPAIQVVTALLFFGALTCSCFHHLYQAWVLKDLQLAIMSQGDMLVMWAWFGGNHADLFACASDWQRGWSQALQQKYMRRAQLNFVEMLHARCFLLTILTLLPVFLIFDWGIAAALLTATVYLYAMCTVPVWPDRIERRSGYIAAVPAT